jgi:hypothetical protein
MVSPDIDTQVRLAMFDYMTVLTARSADGTVTWADLKEFSVNGQAVHLLGPYSALEAS